MSVSSGPSSVEDGLVFAYDMGNGVKSWKGRPTTNLVASPNSGINVTSEDIPTELKLAGVTGYSSYNSGYAVFTLGTTSTASTGKTFTYSIWMRSPGAQSTYLMYVYDGTGSDGGWWNFGSGSLTNSWQKFTYTRSGMTGTVTQVRIYRLNQAGTIHICAPQFEENSFATPFVIGTRSNTQAIVDMTGNHTITAHSLTYNTDGSFQFDGANNYLETSNNIITGNNPFTFECFYNLNSSPGAEIFGNYGGGYTSANYIWISGQYGLYIGGAVYFPGYPISPGIYHMACSRDAAGNCRLYKNGILVNSGTLSSSIAAGPNFRIGRDTGSGGEQFNGNIYSQKLYNRVLSDNEVRQNFNALRSRFGI